MKEPLGRIHRAETRTNAHARLAPIRDSLPRASGRLHETPVAVARASTDPSDAWDRTSLAGRWRLLIFFALAFAISWIPWYTGGSGFLPLGVSVAGLLVVGFTEGRRGLLEIGARLVRWRAKAVWYAVALLLPQAIALAAVAAGMLMGAQPPSFPLLTDQLSMLPLFLAVAILLPTNGPVGEEIAGWRGYAQPRAQSLYGPLLTTFLIGTAWGIWHLPEFFRDGSPQYAMGLSFLGPFILMEISASTVCTWVYNNTNGSTFIGGVLVHGSFNTSASIFFVTSFDLASGTFGLDTRFFMLQAAIMVMVALAIVLGTRGRLGAEGITGAKGERKPEVPSGQPA